MASLVSLMLEAKPQQVVLLHFRESDPAAGPREAAVDEHGAAFEVSRVEVDQLPDLEARGPSSPDETATDQVREGLGQAWTLLRAAAKARRLRCGRIVWPCHVGPDAEVVGRLVERANLVTALAGGSGPDGAGGELVIDLPVVDLDDEQLVDLAEDGGAPLQAFWPCDGNAKRPCEVCPGCRRWRDAFDAAGVAWPWERNQVPFSTTV
jgi:hypothetical protein